MDEVERVVAVAPRIIDVRHLKVHVVRRVAGGDGNWMGRERFVLMWRFTNDRCVLTDVDTIEPHVGKFLGHIEDPTTCQRRWSFINRHQNAPFARSSAQVQHSSAIRDCLGHRTTVVTSDHVEKQNMLSVDSLRRSLSALPQF